MSAGYARNYRTLGPEDKVALTRRTGHLVAGGTRRLFCRACPLGVNEGTRVVVRCGVKTFLRASNKAAGPQAAPVPSGKDVHSFVGTIGIAKDLCVG